MKKDVNVSLVQGGKLTRGGWLTIVSFLLVAVLALSVALGLVVKSHKEDKPVEEVSASGGMVLPEAQEENGISLVSMEIPRSEYAAYGIMPIAESAITVTATAKDGQSSPLSEDQQKFKWTMTWKSSDGGEVTEYVTMSQDGGKTATFSCLQAFSKQIAVTCAWQYDETKRSTVTLDYAKRLQTVPCGYAAFLPGADHYFNNRSVTVGSFGVESSPTKMAIPSVATRSELSGSTGNWTDKILELGVGYTWGTGTIDNSVTDRSTKMYVKFKSGVPSDFSQKFRTDPNGDSHTGYSDVLSGSTSESLGTYEFLKELFRLGSEDYKTYLGDSETLGPQDYSEYHGTFVKYLSAQYATVCIDIELTCQYGDKVKGTVYYALDFANSDVKVTLDKASLVF